MFLALSQAAALLPEIITPIANIGTGIYSIYNFIKQILFQESALEYVDSGLVTGGMEDNQILNIEGFTHDNITKSFEVLDKIKSIEDQGSLFLKMFNPTNFQNALRIGHHIADVFSTVTQSLTFQVQRDADFNTDPLLQSSVSNFIMIRSDGDLKIPARSSLKIPLSDKVPQVSGCVTCFLGVKASGIITHFISMPKQQIVVVNTSHMGVQLQGNSYLGKVCFIPNTQLTYQPPSKKTDQQKQRSHCVVLKKPYALLDIEEDSYSKQSIVSIQDEKWNFSEEMNDQ